jgi:mannose-1-phosphate guanylyltransferase
MDQEKGTDMSNAFHAVIMAGGRGERFWPLSTSRTPKQLLSIFGGKPLIQAAVDRLEGLVPPERIFVITNGDLVDATAAAAPGLPRANIIGEPFGRDTAAACACGLALVKAHAPDGAFCVLTADHIIGDHEVFRTTLRESLERALREDVLLTIGIRPTFASTGYGYIEAGDRIEADGATRFRRARRFVEKPDAETAARYVGEGRYFWNSGMFIWSVRAFEAALARHRPPLAEMVSRLDASVVTGGAFAAALGREYERLEKISVDYAIMEHADNIVMAEGAFEWDDVGSWPSVENHFPRNESGSVVVGAAEELDARDNIVLSQDRLTALIGVRDLVVIQAAGATLICPKDRAQDVKQMVARLSRIEAYRDLL